MEKLEQLGGEVACRRRHKIHARDLSELALRIGSAVSLATCLWLLVAACWFGVDDGMEVVVISRCDYVRDKKKRRHMHAPVATVLIEILETRKRMLVVWW